VEKHVACKLLVTVALLAITTPAAHANCNATGTLTFIGATFDQTRSVWLSTTSAGSFGLEVVNSKDIVDQWSLGAPGQHVSTSPELVFSNGGTHALLDLSGENPCTIDIENQKRDPIILPQLPTLKPLPPIGILPPPDISGIMPELPALRPPGTGITPELPALRPPGTGITPELPVFRPPGTGITPEAAVDPSIPIAVLPPTGITPPIPVDPTSPVGVLPPTGVTPEVPVNPQRPIGSIPPTGITPEVPTTGGDRDPENRFDDITAPARPGTPPVRWVVCIQPQSGEQVTASYSGDEARCPKGYRGLRFEASEVDKSGAPVRARYLGPLVPQFEIEPTLWSLWSQADQVELRDRRGDRDFDSSESSLTLGLHRTLGQNAYLGASLAASTFDSEGLRGYLNTQADRISVGPYFGYNIDSSLTVNGSLNYSYTDTDIALAGFRGGNKVDEWFLNLGLEGFYRWGDWGLLPRAHLNYSYFDTSQSFLGGKILGEPVELNIRDKSGDLSYSETSVVFMRSVKLRNAGRITPYIELGARIAFDLQSDLDTARGITSGGYQASSKVAGFARLGTRWVVTDSNYLDFEISQENIDEDGLEIWRGRLLFQQTF